MLASALLASPAMAQGQAASCAPIPADAPTALFNQFNAAWATKNPDTVTDLFSKDAVLLATVSNVPRTDRAAIRDYFEAFLKGAPVGTINTSNVRQGCNMLVKMGTWTVALTNQNSGVRNNVKARYTFIYKYEDGAWKIAHLHSSMMPISE
ncbi:calcium/calmodulin-dependent protein kinase type II [Sphingomonas humi]|uniref:Calcium/calmodulin-dependent protein kinase type II n=2 Tax=Sphingomonas humi TaxID=335630 RepID=A0ABP7RGV2_9SPHN